MRDPRATWATAAWSLTRLLVLLAFAATVAGPAYLALRSAHFGGVGVACAVASVILVGLAVAHLRQALPWYRRGGMAAWQRGVVRAGRIVGEDGQPLAEAPALDDGPVLFRMRPEQRGGPYRAGADLEDSVPGTRESFAVLYQRLLRRAQLASLGALLATAAATVWGLRPQPPRGVGRPTVGAKAAPPGVRETPLEESRVLARVDVQVTSVSARFFQGGRKAVYWYTGSQGTTSVSVTGGEPTADYRQIGNVLISDSDTAFAFWARNELGSTLRVGGRSLSAPGMAMFPAFVPGTNEVAYITDRDACYSGACTRISERPVLASPLTWSADGRRASTGFTYQGQTDGGLLILDFDEHGMSARPIPGAGAAVFAAQGHDMAWAESVTPDERWVVSDNQRFGPFRDVGPIALSPDGKRLAYWGKQRDFWESFVDGVSVFAEPPRPPGKICSPPPPCPGCQPSCHDGPNVPETPLHDVGGGPFVSAAELPSEPPALGEVARHGALRASVLVDRKEYLTVGSARFDDFDSIDRGSVRFSADGTKILFGSVKQAGPGSFEVKWNALPVSGAGASGTVWHHVDRVLRWPGTAVTQEQGPPVPGRPGWFESPPRKPCRSSASGLYIEQVIVKPHPGLENEIWVSGHFVNGDDVQCESPSFGAFDGEARLETQRAELSTTALALPHESHPVSERFFVPESISEIELRVTAARGEVPSLRVDLRRGLLEAKGGFVKAAAPPPVRPFPRFSERPLEWREIPVGQQLGGASARILRGYEEHGCLGMEDFVIESLHVGRDRSDPEAPLWVLLDATFLGQRELPLTDCRSVLGAHYAALLGSDGRAFRPDRSSYVADVAGTPAVSRWALEPGTRSIRIGFGDPLAPSDVLSVDLEAGTARVEKRSASRGGAGRVLDFSTEWPLRARDRDAYLVRRFLRGQGKKASELGAARSLETFCETPGAGQFGTAPADVLYARPAQALAERACHARARPAAPGSAPVVPDDRRAD